MKPYRLRSTWTLDADPDRVYAALVDVEHYPQWWPQVRSTRQLADGVGEIRCHSLLPMQLTFVAHREVEDPVGRILRARLDGHLRGHSQWTVRAAGTGTEAAFEQEVTMEHPLARLGVLGRPVFVANHGAMMRAGEHGLRAYLSG